MIGSIAFSIKVFALIFTLCEILGISECGHKASKMSDLRSTAILRSSEESRRGPALSRARVPSDNDSPSKKLAEEKRWTMVVRKEANIPGQSSNDRATNRKSTRSVKSLAAMEGSPNDHRVRPKSAGDISEMSNEGNGSLRSPFNSSRNRRKVREMSSEAVQLEKLSIGASNVRQSGDNGKDITNPRTVTKVGATSNFKSPHFTPKTGVKGDTKLKFGIAHEPANGKKRLIEEKGETESTKKVADSSRTESSTPSIRNVTPRTFLDNINATSFKTYETCSTKECGEAAERILNSMDESVEPCDDFYAFACGNFLKNAKIPEDQMGILALSTIEDKIYDQLEKLLTSRNGEWELKSFAFLKKLYAACANTKELEATGFKPATSLLRKLGGWPVVDGEKWDEARFQMSDTVLRFRRHGMPGDYLLQLAVDVNPRDTNSYILRINQPSFGMSGETLAKGVYEKDVIAYFHFMVDIAVLFGADRQRATYELNNSLNFEITLARVAGNWSSIVYAPFKISELQGDYPWFRWLEYINGVIAEPANKLSETDTVILTSPEYAYHLQYLLRYTPKRDIANYVMWRAAFHALSLLLGPTRDRLVEYARQVHGSHTKDSPRWKDCIGYTRSQPAVNAMYVKKHYDEKTWQMASEMVSNIRKEMREIIETADWMDEETRKGATLKANQMVTYLGCPDEMFDDEKINKRYEEMMAAIPLSDFFTSTMAMAKYHLDGQFGKLRERVSKRSWTTYVNSAQWNSKYSRTDNSINVPAGALQSPLFSPDVPRYLNYGAIGFHIGHEVTHAFDYESSGFDHLGRMVNWWQPETKARFLKKIKCLEDQYGNYVVRDFDLNLKLDGKRLLNENVADNSGVRVAYNAYLRWLRKNKGEPNLPGLEGYSPRQMFWIGKASLDCAKYSEKILERLVKLDTHAPWRFRVIGSLSNQRGFARDFNCPIGSNMNPRKKCTVW